MLQSFRFVRWIFLSAAMLPQVAFGQFGAPLRQLTPEELQRFVEGRAAFEAVEDTEDGLGPVFNGTSCAGCHSVGATGGGSDLVETRFGTITQGQFDPLTQLGGSLIQTDGIGTQNECEFVGEVVPAQATITAGRRTTPLFGLGLVDSVPDSDFMRMAARQARFQPETAGRPNRVLDVVSGELAVGKFGWKSQVPNLLHFSGDAYLNEMGITTPLFPEENCPQGDCDLLACDPLPGIDDDLEDVELFHDFMRLLAPPPDPLFSTGGARAGRRSQRSRTRKWLDGSTLFDSLGCANCHVRSLTSGDSDVAALRFKTFHPYSDFLLHDMGPLGDGIEQGEASGREMRTAPLWGLRLLATYLHDGRTSTLEDAILAHDGQARGARRRFRELSDREKAALLAFLRTL